MVEADWEGFSKGEEIKETLISIAGVSGLLLSAILAPGAAGMIGKLLLAYQRDQQRNQSHRYRARIRKIVRQLEARRQIDIAVEGDNYRLTVTEAGRQIIKRFDLEKIIISQPKHWEGRWRIVGFDIPEKQKLARDSLRDLLKRLEFFPLQKSVWIYPYPCRDEIEMVRYAYGLGSELWYCETDTLDRESELLEHFGLLHEAKRLLQGSKKKSNYAQ